MIRSLANLYGAMLVSCGEPRSFHRIFEAWKLLASTQLPASMAPRRQALLVFEVPAGLADGTGRVWCAPLTAVRSSRSVVPEMRSQDKILNSAFIFRLPPPPMRVFSVSRNHD